MKQRHEPNGAKHVISEGKILEIIPVIIDAWGQPWALPPIAIAVDNWLLGMDDEYVLGMPMNFWPHERVTIPGTNSSACSQLSFLVRILERSPDSMPTAGTIDIEAARALVDAIKSSNTP